MLRQKRRRDEELSNGNLEKQNYDEWGARDESEWMAERVSSMNHHKERR